MHCVTPFPKGELPLHPSVVKHFGMDFVTPNRRYRFMNEGLFTFRDYASRYMRYEWNEALEEGLSLARTGQHQAARARLEEAVSRHPEPAAGRNSLSHVLTEQNRLEEAVVEARRAIEIEPGFAPYHAHLGSPFEKAGTVG